MKRYILALCLAGFMAPPALADEFFIVVVTAVGTEERVIDRHAIPFPTVGVKVSYGPFLNEASALDFHRKVMEKEFPVKDGHKHITERVMPVSRDMLRKVVQCGEYQHALLQ